MRTLRLMILATLAFAALIGGCGSLSRLLAPDPRPLIEAKYKLPKGKKIAVLVDDYMAPTTSPGLKAILAQKIDDNLVEGAALRAGDLIPTDAVERAAKENSDGKKRSIQNIGKELSADFVIYVNIVDFNLQSDPENPLVYPKARAYVKVVEVATGERLWPIDVAGEPVEAEGRMEGELAGENPDKSKWVDQLTDLLAAEVAWQFFEHRRDK